MIKKLNKKISQLIENNKIKFLKNTTWVDDYHILDFETFLDIHGKYPVCKTFNFRKNGTVYNIKKEMILSLLEVQKWH